jgi:DNA (cytosine-5)-methyltransferase 1
MALCQVLAEEKLKYESGPSFRFIDLFAGVGGTRLGMESIGGKCVWTSEWDKHSQKTYATNFPNEHAIHGDIREAKEEAIPRFDLLVGGFPCQPFSIAGVSKKNSLGTPHGFECKTQGTLFFDLARIIAHQRPAAFVLENVKNLLRHRKGQTFEVILETLEDELGYEVHYKVINAKHFVPQHRERVFIVGFRNRTDFSWDSLQLPEPTTKLSSILHPQDGSETPEDPFTVGKHAKVNKKYILSDHLWDYLQRYAEKHRAKGNGFGFGLVGKDDISRTLSARYHKAGSEILIKRGPRSNPRRLTPRECARLMGFPDSYKISVSDTQAYRQFGNSVVVPVVKAVAKAIQPHLLQVLQQGSKGQKPRQKSRSILSN